jgi:hypothetical protein
MELKSLELIDCLSKDDYKKVEPFLKYLTCEKCNFIMKNPKYCKKCLQNMCEKCKCTHEGVSASRHLQDLMDKISIKCKYNCSDVTFNLSKIYEHVEQCKERNKYYNGDKDNVVQVNQIQQQQQQPIKHDNKQVFINKQKDIQLSISSLNELVDMEKYIQSNSNHNNNNNNNNERNEEVNVLCSKCKQPFTNKSEYNSHIIKCLNDSDLLNVNESNNDNVSDKKFNFEEYFNKLQLQLMQIYETKYAKIINIYHDNLNKSTHSIEKLLSDINSKETELSKLTKLLSQNTDNSNTLLNLYLQEDSEYLNLVSKLSDLKQQKQDLITQYNSKSDEIISSINTYKTTILSQNKTLIDSTLSNKTESKWLIDLISNYNSLSNKGICSLCKEETENIFTCIYCTEKYCKDKCIHKCKNENCNTYLCLNCSQKCNLCNNIKYCSTCMKNCFYSECKHKFCIECYNKNKHQIRQNNQNCMFFICEHNGNNNNNKHCIMTTLYCPKCEKRICNECIKKDKLHHSILGLI